MSYHPIASTLAYVVSCLLDAVDGQVARARNETSKFGAVLDMVTDRWVCSSTFSLSVDLQTPQLHNVMPALLSRLSISRLRSAIPRSHCARLQ